MTPFLKACPHFSFLFSFIRLQKDVEAKKRIEDVVVVDAAGGIVSVSKGVAIGRRKRVAMAALEENNALFPIFTLTIMVPALVPYTILKLCHAVSKQTRASIASAVTALFQESTEVILQVDFKLLNVQLYCFGSS